MVGLPWHKRDHNARYDETRRISMLAKGMLSDLVDVMYRTGKPLPNDMAYLCHVCAVRDKRQIEKPLMELIAAGFIVETPEGLMNPVAMTGIEEANRHIANGKGGGRPAKSKAQAKQQANRAGSLPDHNPTTAGTEHSNFVENQRLSRNPIEEDQDKKKNPPPTPSASPGQSDGGGGSEIREIIAGFDRLLVGKFGEKARRQFLARSDEETAAAWLSRAEGSVAIVLEAIEAQMSRETDGPPSSLARYCVSVPRGIDDLLKPATLTAGTSSRSGKQQAAVDQGDQTWFKAMMLAGDNGHYEEYEKLKHLAVTDPKQANEIGRSIMEIVSRKKERAAA